MEALVTDIVSFVKEMRARVADALSAVGPGVQRVQTAHTFQAGEATIITLRGGPIEKANITLMNLRDVAMPGTTETVEPTVFQVEVFPENPYCPMGHFNTEWTRPGAGPYYMNLDLFPAVRVEEDLVDMRKAMDGVADRFGRNRDAMREGLDVQYNMDHWSHPLATKVGCKLMKLEEKELDLFIGAYTTFFEAYLKIVKKRCDTPYGAEELRLKGERNGKWLEYIAFKDGAVKMAQAYAIPARVLTGITFPPSVVF
jgi:coproporphyrinogen III oxidase